MDEGQARVLPGQPLGRRRITGHEDAEILFFLSLKGPFPVPGIIDHISRYQGQIIFPLAQVFQAHRRTLGLLQLHIDRRLRGIN